MIHPDINVDNIVELGLYAICAIVLTVLVSTGHTAFQPPLLTLMGIIFGRGFRGVLNPRRASDPPEATFALPGAPMVPDAPAAPPSNTPPTPTTPPHP